MNNLELFSKLDILIKIFNNISDMVYITKVENGQFSYLLANEAAQTFIGISSEAYGKSIDEVLPREAAEIIIQKYKKAIELKDVITYEEKMQVPPDIAVNVKYAPNETVYWESSITPIFNSEGLCTHLIAIVRDITERKEYEKKLEQLALYDYLTGLPNRVLFTERLKEEMSKTEDTKRILGVMFLDLDNFKEVNDSMGHEVGDDLLKQFGNRIKTSLRPNALVARFGGDEFVILLPDLKEEKCAVTIAENILKTFQGEWDLDGYHFKSTTSIGISFYFKGMTHKELLKQADIALYEAKDKGKNNYHIYEKN